MQQDDRHRLQNIRGWPVAPWAPRATFALVLSLVAGPLCGQTMLGVRGGASIASLSQNDDSEPESRTGVAVGMLLETPISQALALRAEGAYVQKGASSDDATLELDYVEFSALLKTGTSGTPSIHVFGGPAVGINTSCRVSAHVIADIVDRLFGSSGIEEGPCDALSEEIVVETFDFGAKVGAEVAMRAGESTRLSLELAYTLGLNDLDGGTKNRTFLIQFGAAIPVG